jgi:hypothetical protein
MRRLRRALVIGSIIGVPLFVWAAPPAAAACHHFMVSASPNPVAEGGRLTVTVSRDAAVAPSHIDLSTVDETAKAGPDYAPLNRTVSFTNDVQQSFPVSIVSHPASEPARTFRLHLSNPGGCAVNPNFVVDPDIRVTIAGHGATATSVVSSTTVASTSQAPTTGTRATTRTTTAAATTTVQTTSPPTTPVATVSTTTTALTGQQAAGRHGGGGTSGGFIALAVVAVFALGGGGFLVYRRWAG